MTRVQIYRTGDGLYRSFACTGHTGYAAEGEDIVCAGVSAIVINTVNCLEDLLHERIEVEYDEDGGDIVCNFLDDPGKEAQLLVDCMIHGLKWIRSQYGGEYLDYQVMSI